MRIRLKIAKYFRRILTFISPRLNTEVLYWVKFGRKLNLKNPITFNEKILWMKFNLFKDNKLVKLCSDKYMVTGYIEEKGCTNILNERIAVYENVEDIEWEVLPQRFAMKLNVGAGKNIIVNDKTLFSEEFIKKQFEKWMKEDYYLDYSEFQYKDVKKVILVERYLGNENGEWPKDYKIFCINGYPKAIMTCVDRESSPKFFFLDKDWKLLPYTDDSLKYPNLNLDKPKEFEEMLNYASILSEPFPFVRVDFYIVNNKIYFGELTFTPTAGMDTLILENGDKELGKLITFI